MSRYVDIEPYEEYVLQRHYRNSMGECVETIPLRGLPIADVQEVRHGRWEWKDDLKAEDENGWLISEQGYVCSECGFIGSDNFRYCPTCGAKMDEVEE